MRIRLVAAAHGLAGQEQPGSNILHASLQATGLASQLLRACQQGKLAEGRQIDVRSGSLFGPRSANSGCQIRADSVEKVGSRLLKEIRLNDNAIFDLICLPPQTDYGRLGLTRSRPMRSPASFPKDSAYDAEKILQCRRTDFFNKIGHTRTSAPATTVGGDGRALG